VLNSKDLNFNVSSRNSGSSGPLWLGDWKYQTAVVTLVPNIFLLKDIIHCYLNKFYEINSLYLYYQFANNYNYSHLIQRKM
jgi:hypothetical protein